MRKFSLVLIMIFGIMVIKCFATEVKVEKAIEEGKIEVTVIPSMQRIKQIIHIKQITDQKKQIEAELTKLSDTNLITLEKQKIADDFDKKTELRKIQLQEDIKILDEIIAKAKVLGVEDKKIE